MADKVETLARTFTHCNILRVKAGTNTPQGGDAGHGGVTILELTDVAGTTWTVKVIDGHGKERDFSYCLKTVRIELYGDAEAETFVKALDFAVKTLKLQRGEL